MASRKHSTHRKRRSKRSVSRSKHSKFKQFVRTVAVSAAVSFAAATWALTPQLRSGFSIEDVLAQFDLGRFFDTQQNAAPIVTASPDGYAQTTFSRCQQFFPNGRPPIVPAGTMLRELCFTPFAILHSGQTKTPVFVAQRLNRHMLLKAQSVERKDRFYEEGRLPRAERATLADYQGSGYDRGHLAPAGDMHSDEAMAQSFSLANMIPQDAQHNRGAWNKIEQDTRKYVMRARGDVYVFTGPFYDAEPDTIGAGSVAVPAYLYKLVYDASSGRSWVHWHTNDSNATADRPISYEEFVRRTGLHLLR